MGCMAGLVRWLAGMAGWMGWLGWLGGSSNTNEVGREARQRLMGVNTRYGIEIGGG